MKWTLSFWIHEWVKNNYKIIFGSNKMKISFEWCDYYLPLPWFIWHKKISYFQNHEHTKNPISSRLFNEIITHKKTAIQTEIGGTCNVNLLFKLPIHMYLVACLCVCVCFYSVLLSVSPSPVKMFSFSTISHSKYLNGFAFPPDFPMISVWQINKYWLINARVFVDFILNCSISSWPRINIEKPSERAYFPWLFSLHFDGNGHRNATACYFNLMPKCFFFSFFEWIN